MRDRVTPQIPAAGSPPVPTVYMDCTETLMAGLNTGIQRVVRSLVTRLPAISRQLNVPCVPVYARGGRLWVLDDPALLRNTGRSSTFRWARDRFVLLEAWLKSRAAAWVQRQPRLRHVLALAWDTPRRLLKTLVRWATRGRATRGREPILATPGPLDVVLLPDAFWTSDIVATLEGGAAAGALVIPVIHDIIPITHPEYFGDAMVAEFTAAFRRLMNLSGAALAVSAATQAQVQSWLRAQGGRDVVLPVAVAHNGADILPLQGGAEPEAPLRLQFAALAGQEFFLMVGTLEPRKGQLLVLNAFEKLWRKGDPAPLMLVGRIGWRFTEIVQRIERSPFTGTRLLTVNDATDAEVDWLYRHATAVILASHAEGFGLPLVEAMHHGTPVIASDIPVFREVGGDYPVYFSLEAPGALAKAVAELRTRLRAGNRPVPRRWATWDEAAPDFIRKALALRDQVRGRSAT